MKKTRFLFALFLAIAMIAISPQRLWALGGSGTSSSPYTIANADDLKEFADIVNGTNGKTRNVAACGKLTADITLTGTWTAMGTNSNGQRYTGIFDGQGYTISGLSISSTGYNQGLFGIIDGATIKNFTLAGTINASNDGVGSVVGRANGASQILDVKSSVNITISGTRSKIGGIVGYLAGSSVVSGCTYSGTLDAGSSYDCIGGIVGFADGASFTGSITYCFCNGTLKSTSTSANLYIGGILGYLNDENSKKPTIQYNFSDAKYKNGSSDISGTYINGIVGRIRKNATNVLNNHFVSTTKITNACNTDSEATISSTNSGITISVTAGSNGSVTKSYVNPTSTAATQLQVVATPNTGYHFDSWSDDSKDQTHNVGLTAKVSLTANFGSWGAGAWTWGSDGKSATCTRTCSHDANHKSSKNVTLGSGITSKEKTAATCMTKGTTAYTATATVEGTQYTDTKDVQDIAALGHSYTSQTENATYLKTGATCTADAVYYYKCSRCTEKGSSTWTKSGSKLGHGKTKGYTPTYTWSNDINAHTCSFTLKCLDCNTNVVSNQSLTGTQTAHTDATCTTAGSTTYKVTGTYSATGSTAYNSDNSKTYTIALLGHDFTVESTDVAYQKSPATCTEDAVYYHKCSRCMEKGETFWTNTGTALGHDMTGHPHVDATCTAAGNEAYWTCSRSCCDGKLFKDEDGTQLWDGGKHIIPALGHDFTKEVATDATRYSDATCRSQAKYYYTCAVCGEIERDDNHTFGYGSLVGHRYNSFNQDTGFYNCDWCGQQQDNGGEEPIEPEPEPEPDPDPDDGGDVIEGEVVTVKCTGTDGSAGFENETYDKAFDGRTSTKWCHNTTNPWVEFTTASPVYVTGYKLSTANDTRNNSSRNPKNWVLKGWSAEKNAWGSLDTKTNDNTLGAVNEKEYRFDLEARTEVTYQRFRIDFTHSGLMQLSEISIMGIDPTALCEHVMTLHGRKEATCTTAGNEEYWTCSKPCCAGTYFKNEAGTERWNAEPVIAGGHDFSQEKAEEAYLHSPATCTAEAHYYYSCTRCNVSEEDANHTFAHGDKLEHVMAHHERKEATCATAGNEEYWTCSQLCCAGIYYKNETGTEKWDAEPVTSGHDFTQQKAEDAYLHSPATCTAQARYYYSCTRCGANEKDPSHTFAHGEKLSHTLDADNVCTECGTHFNATSKAVYADGTLTFYHDVLDHLSDGTVYELNTGTTIPRWFYYVRTSITSVVFNESFADARPTSCYYWFYGCSNLTEITGIENLNTENVTDMSFMFRDCSSLQSLDLSSFNTEKVIQMSYMFAGCSSLQSLVLSSFNTGIVTDMRSMFYRCSSLQSLDLSNFNTEAVTSMTEMFRDCSSLQSLDLSSFNTEKVIKMNYMFAGCSSLQSLDLSSFNTAKVTNMGSMFEGCQGIQSLDLSSFNTGIVTDMSTMFYSCRSLQSLDVSNFNTGKVTNMVSMFESCSSLRSLDISNFDMQKVTSMSRMFSGCTSLKTLTLKSVPFLKQGTFDTKFRGDGVTVNYKLDDNSVIYTGENYLPAATSAPTYTRRGIKNQWGTIVVPFEVGNSTDYDLYTLASVSVNELTLTKVNGPLAANTPALIRLSEAPASPVYVTLTAASNAVDATGALTGSSADGLTLTGSYGVKDITDEQGYIISNNKFWDIQTIKGDNHVYCAPFRAYIASTLSGGNSPQMLSINWEEGTLTSVSDLLNALNGDPSTNSEQALEIYDLNGRRIPALQPGANIVKAANGTTRKVFIK